MAGDPMKRVGLVQGTIKKVLAVGLVERFAKQAVVYVIQLENRLDA